MLSDNECLSELNINEDFAKNYTKRKEEEDILKIKSQFKGQEISEEKAERILERKRKFGLDKEFDEDEGMKVYIDVDGEVNSEGYLDTEEEEEDDQGELITKEVDSQLLKTLVLLKNKDEKVYDKETILFDNKAIEKAALEAKKRKEEKLKEEGNVLTLADLKKDKIKKGELLLGDEEDEPEKEAILSHHEEQKKLKEDLKSAINQTLNESEDDEDDDFFKKRKKTEQEKELEEEDYKNFLLEEMSKADASKKVYDQWANYKDNPNVSKDDAFLMDYILNRGWIDKNVGKAPSYDEVIQEIESEEEIDKADEFESKYNFRFEDPNSHQITSFPRVIPGSLRTKVSKHKKKREKKKLRKEEEKIREEEEVKRKKNIKMQEIISTVKELQKVTNDNTIDIKTLEGELDVDFDPNNYDATFNHKFNDKYYEAGGESDNEKPVFDDDIDIADLEAEQTPEEAKKVKEEAMKLLGEYYKMDYEDKIEDLTTRFKYRKVEKFSGGLDVMDILLAEEKDLNQVVPLRELAPYRETNKKLRTKSNKVKELRHKLIEEGTLPREVYKELKKKDKDEVGSKSEDKKDKSKNDKTSKKHKKEKKDKHKN